MSQSHLVSVFLDVILSNNGYSFSVLPLRLTWARLYWTWSFSKAAADSGSTICSPAFVWQAQESMNSLTVYIFLKVCSRVFWLLLSLLVALTFLKSTFPVTTSEMLPHSMKLPPLMVCLLSSKWSTLNYNGKVFFRLHYINIFNVVFCCLCPEYKSSHQGSDSLTSIPVAEIKRMKSCCWKKKTTFHFLPNTKETLHKFFPVLKITSCVPSVRSNTPSKRGIIMKFWESINQTPPSWAHLSKICYSWFRNAGFIEH